MKKLLLLLTFAGACAPPAPSAPIAVSTPTAAPYAPSWADFVEGAAWARGWPGGLRRGFVAASPAFVQAWTANEGATGNATRHVTGTATTVGNCMILIGQVANATAFTNPADNGGNTYTTDFTPASDPPSAWEVFAHAPVTTAATDAQYSISDSFRRTYLTMIELSGVTCAKDVGAYNYTNPFGTTAFIRCTDEPGQHCPPGTGTSLTTGASDIVVTALILDGNSTNTITLNDGSTARSDFGGAGPGTSTAETNTKAVNSGVTYSPGWTVGNAGGGANSDGVGVAYK